MTLIVGDHLIIKRGEKIVEGEAYHEFEVLSIGWIEIPGDKANHGYRVDLKVTE